MAGIPSVLALLGASNYSIIFTPLPQLQQHALIHLHGHPVREYHNSDASDVTIDLPGAVFYILPVAKYQMYPTISCKA